MPDSPDFHVGYMENRTTQQWVFACEDLAAMYGSGSVTADKEIILWCDKKCENVPDLPSRKRKSTSTKLEDGSSSSKLSRTEENEELLLIMDKLKDKHSSNYTDPQLRLWAKFIQSRRHESLDTPPNIPLITGSTDTRKTSKKDSVGDVVAGAAAAIVNALRRSPKKPTTDVPVPMSYSSNNLANLRRKHLEDL